MAHVGNTDYGVEFFIHPVMQASPENGFPRVLSAGPGWATAGHSSSSEEVAVMIKSDVQRERTVAQIEGFRQALAKVEQEKLPQSALLRSGRAMRA